MTNKYSQQISIEKAKEDYVDLIKESIDKKLWFKAKGLNLWLSPYELQDGWEFGKYLLPVNYWHLCNPNEYLRPFSDGLRKAQNKYDYAHKRYKAYVKRLSNTPINI